MLDCNLSMDEIIKKYPFNTQITLISWSGTAVTNSVTGYFNELQLLGASSPAPILRNFRLLSSIDSLKQNEVYFDKITFEGYDSIIEGGSGQDTDNYAEIIASRLYDKAFAQSYYQNGMMPVNFQPNAFRPSIIINNKKYYSNVADPVSGTPSPIADLTIGYPLTYCFPIQQELPRLEQVNIRAAFAQYISSSASIEDKWVNYPIIARCTIRNKTGK